MRISLEEDQFLKVAFLQIHIHRCLSGEAVFPRKVRVPSFSIPGPLVQTQRHYLVSPERNYSCFQQDAARRIAAGTATVVEFVASKSSKSHNLHQGLEGKLLIYVRCSGWGTWSRTRCKPVLKSTETCSSQLLCFQLCAAAHLGVVGLCGFWRIWLLQK
jgi:hypothetical protein